MVHQRREQLLYLPEEPLAIDFPPLSYFKYAVRMTSTRSEESTQSKQRITTIVLAILAIIFLLLRLVARRMKRIGLGVDDWTLIVGLVGLVLIREPSCRMKF